MWEFLVAPVVGGVIGYITNDLAIKMLFHPHRSYYIGKWHIPFTPGLIPSQKTRIAKSIGHTVSENLLDHETILNIALSDETIGKIRAKIEALMNQALQEQRSLRQLLSERINEEKLNKTIETVKKECTPFLIDKVTKAHIGDIVAAQIIESVQGKLGSLSPLLNDGLSDEIRRVIAPMIDNLVSRKGEDWIQLLLLQTEKELLDQPLSTLCASCENRMQTWMDAFINSYASLLKDNLQKVLRIAEIDVMITNKINSFNASEMEKLIFGLMKKELKAIVYLGAILGFFMGFINLLF